MTVLLCINSVALTPEFPPLTSSSISLDSEWEQLDECSVEGDICELAERVSRWVAFAKSADVASQTKNCNANVLWNITQSEMIPSSTLLAFGSDWPSSSNIFLTRAHYTPRHYFVLNEAGSSMAGECYPILKQSSSLSGIDAIWNSLRRSIERWSRLPHDWDGDDGIAPTEDAISHARTFLKQIRALSIKAPSCFISGDGEIGFRWIKDGRFASAAFLPDGHFVGFIDSTEKKPALKVDIPAALFTNRVEFFERLADF